MEHSGESVSLAAKPIGVLQRFFGGKHGERTLGWVSFAESFILPIVTDPFLIAVVLADGKKWFRATVITTVTSVLGALAAYVLGYFFWGAVGADLLATFHFEDAFQSTEQYLAKGVVAFTLIGAITPVPYKLVAILSGVFHLALVPFVLASLFGRFTRYVIVAYAVYRFGGLTHLFRAWREKRASRKGHIG